MHPLAALAAAHSPPARAWSDDEREMMSFLLLGGSPSGVDERVTTPGESSSSSTPTAASAAAPPAAAPAKTSGGKAKLSALERRAKHREVVRRSYHRNKAVLTDLKDAVRQLEGQKAALDAQPPPVAAAALPPAAAALKRQVAELTATSAQLQREAAQLQQTLHAHQRFVAVASAASTASEGSSSSDEEMDDGQQQQPTSPWREPAGAETSDEDLSPAKRQPASKFYRSPRPALVSTPTPRAPVEAARCRELGFAPLTLERARVFVGETYQGIRSFSLSGRAVTTGARVMGWEDKRLADGTTVRFSLRKQFAGENASALMAETWQCFSDPECSDKKFRGLMTLHILQHLNEDTIVALRDTESPDGATLFRCVYLLVRVRTRSGYIICTRSIHEQCVGERERGARSSRDGRAVHWVELFSWFVFDQLGYADSSSPERFHETGAQVEYGGSVDFGDASLLPAIAMDTLATATRWESFMAKPSFLLARD